MASRLVYRAGYAVRHPVRVWNRVTWDAKVALFRPERGRAQLFQLLQSHYGVDAAQFYEEYRRSAFRRRYEERRLALETESGIRSGTTSAFDCEALYVLVRCLRPRVMVETGVLYGASSAHFLAAMRANGEGVLYSLDRANDPAEPSHDFLVPEALRSGWIHVVGDIRDTLPRLLGELGAIDYFHHDSSHAFDHMLWEYEIASAHLGATGVLTSHNVIVPSLHPNAFRTLCRRRQRKRRVFRNLGVMLPEARPLA